MTAQDKLDSVGYMQLGEDWPELIKRIVDTLNPESVLDVGCGPCRSMLHFKNFQVPLVKGIDGAVALLDNPNVQPHLDDIVLVNLEQSPCVLGRKFELVWSYEVAEHIGNVDNYLITLTDNAEKYIVMTAAPPSQGGTHHVNCQEQKYWIDKITARGFEYVPELVNKFKEGGWQKTGYMAVSGMVFRRKQIVCVQNTEDVSMLKLGAHYCCFKDKRATYQSLLSFRQHYPEAPVHLISDGGDDFSGIAKVFNCDYTHGQEQSGNGKSTFLETNYKVMLWLNRLKATCMNYQDVDWIVILEDDVHTRGRVKHMPQSAMAGPCTMEFTAKAKAALKKRHKNIQINPYSGCGGTIIHRQTFLKCMDNMFDIDWAKSLDHRLANHSDAILTFLFLYNGQENTRWADHSETSQGRGSPDAAFDHQFKEYYGKAWNDEWLVRGIPQPKTRARGLPMKFHLLGLAHLPARWEYTPCAYTYKILRLAKMLKMRGHEVVFYGVENSEVECDEFVPVVPQAMWHEAYGKYDWRKSANFSYDSTDIVHKTFNENSIKELRKRGEPRDFLLCTMGWHHKPIADTAAHMTVVESGIGYEGIFAKFKVFESYAWMHFMYGKHNTNDGNNYDCVIPNYYDSKEFPVATVKPEPYLLHVSRLIERKGIRTSVEVSRALKVPLVVAGQGDISQFITPADTHIKHVGVVGGAEKMKLFSEATALIQPTVYIGPFEGVTAEAQLCGVPCLTTDFGCFAENVEQGKTGFRCRTLREFVEGYKRIVAGELSNSYIRDRAVSLWDLVPVSKQYETYFYRLLDLYGQGWYSLGD